MQIDSGTFATGSNSGLLLLDVLCMPHVGLQSCWKPRVFGGITNGGHCTGASPGMVLITTLEVTERNGEIKHRRCGLVRLGSSPGQAVGWIVFLVGFA